MYKSETLAVLKQIIIGRLFAQIVRFKENTPIIAQVYLSKQIINLMFFNTEQENKT